METKHVVESELALFSQILSVFLTLTIILTIKLCNIVVLLLIRIVTFSLNHIPPIHSLDFLSWGYSMLVIFSVLGFSYFGMKVGSLILKVLFAMSTFAGRMVYSAFNSFGNNQSGQSGVGPVGAGCVGKG